ncbi:hypothetical protein [Gimesia panareensis]|uniref:Uncharacterized protein n=1 Tax=Gimesia panareensis TaxID=2527978 RepID=A0A518AAD6_9PLAN|nr:hypothetical protein [Gimesia panareensis]QDU51625.1 hypothetical protein Pan110_39920 [Gimesia panareensis]QDV19563.1 hypothetical protein Pan153_42290 [Gimesia panareensis]
MDEAFKNVAGKGKDAAENELKSVIGQICKDIDNGTLKPYNNKDVIVLP